MHLKHRRNAADLDHVVSWGEAGAPPASPQGSGSLSTSAAGLGLAPPPKMTSPRQRRFKLAMILLAAALACLMLMTVLQNRRIIGGIPAGVDFLAQPPVLVSYSYFEKDAIQVRGGDGPGWAVGERRRRAVGCATLQRGVAACGRASLTRPRLFLPRAEKEPRVLS